MSLNTLDSIVQALGADLAKAADQQGRVFARYLAQLGFKEGLDKPRVGYLFFMLLKQRSAWPGMIPESKKALSIGLRCMLRSKEVPNFNSFMAPPETSEQEEILEQIIKTASFWCLRDLNIAFLDTYSKLLDYYTPILGKIKPELETNHQGIYLDSLIQVTLRKRPGLIFESETVRDVMNLIF